MEERLEWTDWPAARATGRATLACAVIGATSVGVVAIDPLLGFVGTVLLLVSVTDFMLPTEVAPITAQARVARPVARAAGQSVHSSRSSTRRLRSRARYLSPLRGLASRGLLFGWACWGRFGEKGCAPGL